ncbi:MAG: DUF2169 domain-containing protein [Polyangiaceae bacterium]|nr:DUF2169 domain-containing protein [Polyangiaceae bacterium]
MEIVSLCHFPAALVLWEAQPQQWSLSICVKGTFSLVHGGEAEIAGAQEPIGIEDRRRDAGAGDLAPVKPRVDVMLVGHAYAPGGRAVQSLAATLRVGDFAKTVLVTGDQRWVRGARGGLEIGAPELFARMPLRYERAALSADNPVGIDPGAPAAEGRLARPSVEATEQEQAPGFGPIAAEWWSRRGLLDEPARAWALAVLASGRSPGPAPAGLDFGFFNAAPRDQQLELVRAGAPISLENLHPAHARLTTCLPAIRPQAFRVDPRTGRAADVALRCDTIWIDSDRAIAAVTWRGLIDVASGDPAAIGRVVVVADPAGKRVRWERVDRALRGEAPLDGAPEPAEIDPLAVRHDALKARPPRTAPPPARRPSRPAPRPSPSAPPAPRAAPSAPGKPALAPLRLAADPDDDELPTDMTVAVKPSARGAALPFRAAPAAPAAAPRPAAPHPLHRTSEIAGSLGRGSATPSAPPVIEEQTTDAIDAAWTDDDSPPPQWPARPAPAPPAPKGQGHAGPPGVLSLERYAEIAAEIALGRADRDHVLAARGITSAAWSATDAHWTAAIAKDAEAGEGELLAAFDAAYVAAL